MGKELDLKLRHKAIDHLKKLILDIEANNLKQFIYTQKDDEADLVTFQISYKN